MLEKEAAKMLEVIPGRVRGDKDSSQKFSGMVIDRQQQGLLGRRRPPLVDGGIVLPKFTEAGAFPPAAGLGARFRWANQVGKVGADKGGDGLAVALKTETGGQLIGDELKVGGLLQGDEILEKLADFWWPIRPVIPTGEVDTELGTVEQPPSSEPIKMSPADLEMEGSIGAVDQAVVKLLEDLVEDEAGDAGRQLLFDNPNWNRAAALGRGFAVLVATLRPPQTLDQGLVFQSERAVSF